MIRRFTVEVKKDYLNFAAAHFLIFANGKREALHGHNYQVSVALEGELDSAGIVLNFTSLKPLVKEVCDALDHRTLVQSAHPGLKIRKGPKEIRLSTKTKERLILPRRDVLLLPMINTTTEFLAEFIATQLRRKISRRFPKSRVHFIEVGVEENRGQRGIFRGEF